MRRTLIGVSGAAVLVLVVVQAGVLAPTVSAHEHPTPVERDSPGVVFVETRAHVEISLIELAAAGADRITLTQRTYEPVLSSGSGFAVDPSGFIVTSTETISPDRRPAEVYAVNQLFSERYGAAAPLPANPFVEQQVGAGQDGRLNQRLQRCYRPNTTDASGGCVMRTSLRVTVYPYVTSQESYGALAAKVLSRNIPDSEVSVVKVGASSMPTVELATSASGASALAVLGFSGIPGESSPLEKVDAHFNTQAGTAKAEDVATLVPGLERGLRGGPVVAEQGQVVGFFPWTVAAPGQPAGDVSNPPRPVLVDAATVQSVLSTVGVTPKRGPTDFAFEDALHSFKNDEFAGSIPSLQSTVKSYPGHFVATANLEVAEARRGTAADLTGQGSGATPGAAGDGGSSTLAWVAGLIAGAAVLATLALLLLRRRRRPGSPEPTTASAPDVRAASGVAASGVAGSGGSPPVPRTGTPAPRAPGDEGVAPITGQAAVAGRAGQRESAPLGVSTLFVRAEPEPEPAAGRPAAGGAEDVHTYCTRCGQRLAPNHRYCGWCGHHID